MYLALELQQLLDFEVYDHKEDNRTNANEL